MEKDLKRLNEEDLKELIEKEFKDLIETLKSSDMNVEKLKKYIAVFQRYLSNIQKNCGDEFSNKEILEEFLEEYNKELQIDPANSTRIYYEMLQYKANRELIRLYKSDKPQFTALLREARYRQSISSEEEPKSMNDPKEHMILAIRSIIKSCPQASEKQLLDMIRSNKSSIASQVKNRMIKDIQSSITYLEEYGFIDEYIAEANEQFEELGLRELKLSKRNPIADEKYSEDGRIVKDDEDIGVMDTFSDEYLNSLTPEDLLLLYAFWKSKYLDERLEMSKAMSVIKSLDLWDNVLENDGKTMESVSDAQLKAALKSDLALTYLCKNKGQITPNLKRRYTNFLKENNMVRTKSIMEELSDTKVELDNLQITVNDLALAQCIIIYALQSKDFDIKNWGILNLEEEEKQGEAKKEDDSAAVIAIDSNSFRGPLIMSIPVDLIRNFFGIQDLNLPYYKNEESIDYDYSKIMSRFYLPTNPYFKNVVRKAYNGDPSSELFANLAGKKKKNNKLGDGERV